MHVQVSTSYFKMLKQVSLYAKQFPIVGCGQISLLMPKTHSTVQRGSNSLFNKTHLFILFTRSTEAFSDICMFTRFRFHYLACTLYQLIWINNCCCFFIHLIFYLSFAQSLDKIIFTLYVLKNQHFKILIRSGNSGWRATSWKWHCKFPFPLYFYYKSLQSHALNQYKIDHDPH